MTKHEKQYNRSCARFCIRMLRVWAAKAEQWRQYTADIPSAKQSLLELAIERTAYYRGYLDYYRGGAINGPRTPV